MKILTVGLAIFTVSLISASGMTGEAIPPGLNIGSNDTSTDYYNGALIGQANWIYPAGNVGITASSFLTVGDGNMIYYVNNSIIAGVENSGEYYAALTIGSFDGSLASNSLVVGAYNSSSIESGLVAGTNNSLWGIHQFALGRGLINVSGFSYDDWPAIYLGQYNNNNVQGGSPPILVIGNGTGDSNRSNALEVLRNGDVNIPSGKLTLNGQPFVTSNSGNISFGDSGPSLNSAWKGAHAVGIGGYDKVVLGPLASTYTGATIAGHNSALNAWANLNIAGSNLIFRSNGETEQMRINANGNVGIGTANPDAKLEVVNTSGRNSSIKISASGGYAPQLYFKTSSAGLNEKLWDFLSSGTQFFGRIVDDADTVGAPWLNVTRSGNLVSSVAFPNGNVGINISVPLEKLTVVDGGDLNPFSGTFGVYAHNRTQGITIGYTGITKTGSNSNGDLAINAKGTGNLVFQTNASGNVGIGTANPISNLHVLGNAKSNSDIAQSGNSNLTVEGNEAGRTPGMGAAIGFVVPGNTNGSNRWEQGRILVTPDNGNNGDANGRMYLQTRYYGSGAWRWRDNIVLKPDGVVSIPKRQGDVLMGEFGTPNSGD